MLIVFSVLVALFILGFMKKIFKLPTKVPSPKAETFNDTITTNMVIRKPCDQSRLKMVFATFDKNKDGFITKQELRESFEKIGIGMSDKEVAEMVEKSDVNGDGLIEFDEFCNLYKSIELENEDEGQLREAFDVFDGDKDGMISVDELGVVLKSLGIGEGGRVENCKEMINKVDKDGDGMVSFDEFKIMMRSNGGILVNVS